MEKIDVNYKLVNNPTIDWAEFEQDHDIFSLTDIRKNVLSSLVILMYQNKENFGKIFKVDPNQIRLFFFAKHLTNSEITRSTNFFIKKKILICVQTSQEKFFTVPRFFQKEIV